MNRFLTWRLKHAWDDFVWVSEVKFRSTDKICSELWLKHDFPSTRSLLPRFVKFHKSWHAAVSPVDTYRIHGRIRGIMTSPAGWFLVTSIFPILRSWQMRSNESVWFQSQIIIDHHHRSSYIRSVRCGTRPRRRCNKKIKLLAQSDWARWKV